MRRKQSDETDPADWFYLAEDRLRAADVLWKAEGLTASGIELLQEAAERYLKGYLVARGWRLVKTHDLEALLDAASSFDPAFGRFAAFAEELTEDFLRSTIPDRIGPKPARIMKNCAAEREMWSRTFSDRFRSFFRKSRCPTLRATRGNSLFRSRAIATNSQESGPYVLRSPKFPVRPPCFPCVPWALVRGSR